jgi:RecB family exonuclease
MQSPRPANAVELARFSPTTVNSLTECPYRVVLERRDSSLRRPNLFSALGNVAHSMNERAWKGSFDIVSTASMRGALQAAWDELVALEAERLAQAVAPATPPGSSQWPGIALTRSRTIRRLGRLIESRLQRGVGENLGWVAAEREFVDSESALYGRVDRLEKHDGHLRVVDLKSGTAQRDVKPAQRRQLLLYALLVHKSLGEWPAEVVIESASGEETVIPVEPDEAERELADAVRRVDVYNSALRSGSEEAVLQMATPSPEACRYCSARVVCDPYWDALATTWPYQGAVRGEVVAVRSSEAGRSIDIRVSHPRELAGTTAQLFGELAPDASVGAKIAVVGAVAVDGGIKLRTSWDVQVRFAEPA